MINILYGSCRTQYPFWHLSFSTTFRYQTRRVTVLVPLRIYSVVMEKLMFLIAPP
jgi:hypothetical protein